jgi:ketosteroid isomerase-like protein
MYRWLFAAVVVAASPWSLAAQTAQQEITKAEQARLEGRAKGDAATLARFSSDDLLTVGPSGQAIGKKETVALQAVPMIASSDVKTQVFGDTAVVTGIQTGIGAQRNERHRFTRVWHKRNGQWLNVFGQVTRIVAPAPVAATPPVQPTVKQVPPTQWPAGKTQDERDVLQTQRSLNELFAKKDAAAYGQLTADSFIRVNPNGTVSSREEFLKAVAATPEISRTASNNSDIRVNVHGIVATVTVIDRTATGSPAGIRMTRVYAKQNGTWKQLVTQATAIVPQQ